MIAHIRWADGTTEDSDISVAVRKPGVPPERIHWSNGAVLFLDVRWYTQGGMPTYVEYKPQPRTI